MKKNKKDRQSKNSMENSRQKSKTQYAKKTEKLYVYNHGPSYGERSWSVYDPKIHNDGQRLYTEKEVNDQQKSAFKIAVFIFAIVISIFFCCSIY